jgi:hypothetical protein
MKDALKRSAVWKIKKVKQAGKAVAKAHAEYVENTPTEVRIKRIERAYWYIAAIVILAAA